MTNIYDYAHDLARAIKQSDEYKNFNRLKEVVAQNEELNNMIADFRQKQIAFQTQQMMAGMTEGAEPDAEFMAQIQELYQILMQDPVAAEYLQAEMQFSKMIGDIYGILGEVMQIV